MNSHVDIILLSKEFSSKFTFFHNELSFYFCSLFVSIASSFFHILMFSFYMCTYLISILKASIYFKKNHCDLWRILSVLKNGRVIYFCNLTLSPRSSSALFLKIFFLQWNIALYIRKGIKLPNVWYWLPA